MSTDPSTTTWLPTGAVLEGRWQIQGKLGRGGFATVYHGQHVKLEREAAIKVLDIQSTPEEMQVFEKRFLREAKLAAKLDHPNIVQVLDYGLTRREGVTKPFLVMERLSGHDLEHELISRGPLTRDRARALFLPALDALFVCHQQGIVHRDLKPSNLFIVHPNTPRERLVIVDFGIARAFEDQSAHLTATSHFTGTPAYLAPEYISEQKVSPAIDVYQMGLILSEALTGTPVIQASAPLGYLMAHCNGQQFIPEPLASTPVGQVLRSAVSVAPEDRPRDAGELKAALEHADWEPLPRRWDTIKKSSVEQTFPQAPVPTQDGVNPWGETAAPAHTPPELTRRPEPQEIPTDPIAFDASATHPDMVASPHRHGTVKIVIAAIFALGVLLAGGALMLIALRAERTTPDVVTTPPHEAPIARAQADEPPQQEPPSPSKPLTAKVVDPPTSLITDAPVAPTSIKKEKVLEQLATIDKEIAKPKKELLELLEPTDEDAKLLHGHLAIEAMTLSVELHHAALHARLDKLGEDRALEIVSFFSDFAQGYERAAKNLDSLARHAPAMSKLDARASKLSSIMKNLAEHARASYDYQINAASPHTNARALEFVSQLDTLMAAYRPAHDAFLSEFLAREQAILKARFDRIDSRSSPLMYHYHGVMLSLVRAMSSMERYQNTKKTKPFVLKLDEHTNKLERIDLASYKDRLESQHRNNLHTSALSAKRASPAFAEFAKAYRSYEKSDKPSHQQKLESAYVDLRRRYNFALKKYVSRPEL